MTREELHELASLHVIGALPADEARAFEEQLRRDPELQTLYKQLQSATDVMALNVKAASPSPQLKDRIMAATAGSAREKIVSFPRPQPRGERHPIFVLIPWALAACLVVVVGRLWLHNAELQRRVDSYASMMQKSQQQITVLQAAVEELRGNDRLQAAVLNPLPADTASKASGVSLWNAEKEEGTLVVKNLAALPAGKDYQLWVIEKDKPPVDAGVFTVDENGSARIRFKPKAGVQAAATFAITLEKKGGVPAPEGAMMLLGNLL